MPRPAWEQPCSSTHPWQAKLRKLTIKKSLSYGIKTFHCTVNMVAHWKKPMSKNIYIYVNIYCLLRLHHFQEMGQRHLQSITAVKGVCACLFTMKGFIRRQVAILISHFPTSPESPPLFTVSFTTCVRNHVTAQEAGLTHSSRWQ